MTRLVFLFAALAGLLVFLVACSQESMKTGTGDKQTARQETALEHAAKHLDPTYVCPMHPQIVKDKPGACPICGMDLVLKQADPAEVDDEPRRILYYRHPHNPSITSDRPMQDEMGMDYVPIYDDGGGATVKISPVVEHNLGVRTARVERDKLWRHINTVGYVDFDENKISHIHMRTEGWIEKLLVKSEGERVSKGQLLFELYSPELVNAQEEFLQALRTGNKRLVNASRERLIALGISAKQIEQLTRNKKVDQYVRVYARQDGIVSKLNIREGMFVTPKMEVLTLADLSSVWLLAEVFESQADWVATGQPAEVQLSYVPGKVWEGNVEYIYPSLNQKTRTLKVRLRFDNPDEELKPNMFANVVVHGGAKPDVLVIPREALIRTGQQDRVILSVGDGRYQQRQVVAGIESGDRVEINSGLQAGDMVVTSGQFLIDSEASLKASLQRMSQPAAEVPVSTRDTKGARESGPIKGNGVIVKLDPVEQKVNMSHEAIPRLGWPQMTMDLRVDEGVALSEFQPQDKVGFELRETGDGYVISKMRKLNP
jgi:Cu(I)/Ag(I) efflux system membrane fusion protein